MSDAWSQPPQTVTVIDEAAEVPDLAHDDGMTDLEREIAAEVYEAMQESMRRSDRSAQAQQFRVGISDLGYCSERLRRFLDRQVPDDVDMLSAFIGTWLGAGIEHAYKTAYPQAVIQSETQIVLPGETNTYTIPGHPDIVDPSRGLVLDGKTSFGLRVAERTGMADQQKMFQRHCYGYAAWTDGLLGDIPLERVLVGNVWLDRSGQEKRLLVKTEPLNMEVVQAATRWLDEVVYRYQHQQEAEKEPAREVCATTCGFFKTCRAYDTDVEGFLTDPVIRTAVDLSLEATSMGSTAKKMAAEAKAHLADVRGSTGTHLVRWIEVEATENRAGYKRLSITKIKEPKVKPTKIEDPKVRA